MGVLHGIRTFLPHIRAHGEGGHIVNTASMAGMINGMGFSPYSASKFAVVSMSEGLAPQLKPLGIGVSVLCPGFVRTGIGESGRNRPQRYGPTPTLDPASPAAAVVAEIARRLQAGLDPGGGRRARPRRHPRTTNSTCSRTRKCAVRSSSGLPRSRRRWTRRRAKPQSTDSAVPPGKTTLDMPPPGIAAGSGYWGIVCT